MPVNLLDNCVLGAWKCKLFKTGFQSAFFENDTIIFSVKKKVNLWKQWHHACITCSVYRRARALEECICAHTRSVSLQSDIANYWPGMRNTARLVVWTGIVLIMLSSVHETSKKQRKRFSESWIHLSLDLVFSPSIHSSLMSCAPCTSVHINICSLFRLINSFQDSK